ncbi:uncharacterized protein LOC104901482 [Beta vulgaris subsp. vulgaris]|uniref:uncharacterized protein LOC104901482 n=1 Tax=Beta vulgaris subsp. vulgaris TaxID=3555 RepID=UPI00053F9C5D|nr:uncharacterized protein LOC104901482 [Beta vulgaris subsp. vulgaris]
MVARRQTSVGSSSDSRGNSQGSTKCSCARELVLRTAKRGANVGQKFYGCPLWPDTKCDFFKWYNEQGSEVDDLRFQIFEKETTLTEMEYEKSLMAEKIKKLQLKKDNLEEDMQEMKFELSQLRIEVLKMSRNEKNLTLALFVSWLVFAIFLYSIKLL